MGLFDYHQVEFPGLGWEFTITRGFTIGGFKIYWYAIIIACGLMLAVIYALRNAKGFRLNSDNMMDVALVTIPFAFIGARLYYVLFSGNLSQYTANPASILNIRDGGLGIYGGIIVAFIVGPLVCKFRKVNILSMFDVASMGFLIGQSVGRWGNFFNQEAFGGNTTLPWGMTGDIIRSGRNGSSYVYDLPVHPTFLYESLWCLLGFVLLHLWFKKAYKFKGQIFCGYIVWYGLGRFCIESLRTDSLMIGSMPISQLVAALAVIGGSILFLMLRRHAIALPRTLEIAPEDDLQLEAYDGEEADVSDTADEEENTDAEDAVEDDAAEEEE